MSPPSTPAVSLSPPHDSCVDSIFTSQVRPVRSTTPPPLSRPQSLALSLRVLARRSPYNSVDTLPKTAQATRSLAVHKEAMALLPPSSSSSSSTLPLPHCLPTSCICCDGAGAHGLCLPMRGCGCSAPATSPPVVRSPVTILSFLFGPPARYVCVAFFWCAPFHHLLLHHPLDDALLPPHVPCHGQYATRALKSPVLTDSRELHQQPCTALCVCVCVSVSQRNLPFLGCGCCTASHSSSPLLSALPPSLSSTWRR